MAMARFATLYSGSSGNSAVVLGTDGYLLIDVGKNCKQTLLGLQALGLSADGLRGVLVTHEHSDHIGGLRVFLKRCPVPVYGSAATLTALQRMEAVPSGAKLAALAPGMQADVAGFGVTAFATSHDSAGCCGFAVQSGASRMSLATDLGCVDDGVYASLAGSGLVALEANYDRVMLQMGPYPYYLKQRIASDRGHLSNLDCACTLAALARGGCRRFALCHLSAENNTPQLALEAVAEHLREEENAEPGSCLVQVSPRQTVSDWIDF